MAVQTINPGITPRELVLETLGTRGKLPCKVSMIVGSYLSEKELSQIYAENTGILGKLNPMCIDFLALNQRKVLRHFLSAEGQAAMPAAIAIAQRVYESRQRLVKGGDGCWVYPMYPEVLGYAMQHVQGGTVVEMGGVSGENVFLLTLAGAAQGVLNDLNPEELRSGKQIQMTLPRDIQRKIQILEGDCLKVIPKLQNVDVAMARNLLHFFNDAQLARFLQGVGQMIGNSGVAIITVNVKNPLDGDNAADVYEAHPDTTSFKKTFCVITDYAISRAPKHILLQYLQPCSPDEIGNPFEEHYLYTVDPGQKWKVHNSAFKALDPSIKGLVKSKIESNKHLTKPIKYGGVRVFSNYARYYSQQNLEQLVKRHGFAVDCSFAVDVATGHLSQTIHKNVRQIGVVIRNRG